MADIDKSIELAQRLRALIMKIVASEKDEAQEEEEKSSQMVSDFFEEEMLDWNKADDAAAAWGKMSAKEKQAYFKNRDKLNKQSRKAHLKRAGKKLSTNLKEQDTTAATAILAQIDQLLYSLMDYEGGGEGWNDEADYEERTQMKLKEVVPPSVFPL